MVVSSPAFAQNLTELRFLPGGFTINGQPPVVLFERDAEQILNAQVSYEVDSGYPGGHHLFARVEPFGASPAKLTSSEPGLAPGCATSTTAATVDVLLQNGEWTPSGARVGYSAAPFPLPDPPPPERPEPEARSFQFAFGVLCQDSDVERTEQFRVTVWFQTGSVADPDSESYPTLQYIVRIEDDDSVRPVVVTGDLELLDVVETDVDFVPVQSLELDGHPDVNLCYPFVIGYGESTASRADVDLVASRTDFTPVPTGVFLVLPGDSTGVTSNVLVKGDQVVESPEVVVLYVYAGVPLPPGMSGCSPDGEPTLRVIFTIQDDDAPLNIESVTVESAIEGVVFEGDAGSPPLPVHVLVNFSAFTDEPVTLRFGSQIRGTASEADVEFVSEDRQVVPIGQRAARLLVAHVVADNRVEAAETFLAWVEIDGYPSTRAELVITIGNDDVTGDEILTVELVGFDGLSVPEGDPAFTRVSGDTDPCRTEWRCVPLRMTLSERQTKDVVYELSVLGGTAVPHEDYVPLDRVRLTLEEGHLSALYLDDPLRLEIRRDYVSERQEDFYLVVHQLTAGGTPLLSWFEQIVIEDDDEQVLGENGVWFGTSTDMDACPEPSGRLFEVDEPAATGAALTASLSLLALTVDDGQVPAPVDSGEPAVSPCSPLNTTKPVDYFVELEADTAALGVDIALSGGVRGNVVRFVNGVAELELLVIGDGEIEPVESLDLQLYSGRGEVASFTILVHDFETRYELGTADMALYARLGRAVASEVSDMLAERFSCAGAAACVEGDRELRSDLLPDPPLPRSVGPLTALRRVASALAPAAQLSAPPSPGLAPSLAFSGAASSAFSSSRPGGTDSGVASPLDGRYRAAMLGRAIDGLRFQGDPGRWLGRDLAGPVASSPAWSAWGRTSFSETHDRGSTSRSLSTSLLAFSGGVDRRAGPLRLGWLHSRIYATDEVDYHWRAAEVLAAGDRSRSSAWQVTAPYVGVVPHRRLRLWVSPGWVWGHSAPLASSFSTRAAAPAGAELAPLRQLSPTAGFAAPQAAGALGDSLQALYPPAGASSSTSMRFLILGGSMSLVTTQAFAADIEGDFFDVGSVSVGGVSNALVYAQRRRLAVRIGFPVGSPHRGRSRVTLRAARRWDSGTDLDWVWGGIRPVDGWVGAGFVAATDLMADYRLRAPRASLSLVLTAGVQFDGELPVYGAEERRGDTQSSRTRIAATLNWGASGRAAGWSLRLRPSYGNPSVGMPGWWDGAVLGALPRIHSVPMVDAEFAYAFRRAGRVSVGAQTFFDDRRLGADGSRRTAGVVRYFRGW